VFCALSTGERNAESRIALGVSDLGALGSSSCVRKSIKPKQSISTETGPAGPSSLADYKTCRANASFAGPSDDGPTQARDLDFAPWHAPQDEPLAEFWQGKVLARQKPTMLLRLVGTVLLLLAGRRFTVLLWNEPSRNIRLLVQADPLTKSGGCQPRFAPRLRTLRRSWPIDCQFHDEKRP
jgi:hypothetical protein